MTKELLNKIKECIIYHPELGGRSVLEIDVAEAEEIIKLAINEYHNSKCPECGNKVSCVCTSECSHIWYCSKHVLNHKHRKSLITKYQRVMIEYQCPKCKGVLTPWGDDDHVCDVCGYGKKDYTEFNMLQQTKIPLTRKCNA